MQLAKWRACQLRGFLMFSEYECRSFKVVKFTGNIIAIIIKIKLKKIFLSDFLIVCFYFSIVSTILSIDCSVAVDRYVTFPDFAVRRNIIQSL